MFYYFSIYLNSYHKPAQRALHTIISNSKFALNALQNQRWPYFIDRLIEYSQIGLENLPSLGISDRGKTNVVYNTIGNLKIINEMQRICTQLLDTICTNIYIIYLFCKKKKMTKI